MIRNRRQALGQHFLRDGAIIDKIVQNSLREAARLGCASIVEIGCGDGALSVPLAAQKPDSLDYRIVETDERLAIRMRDKVGTRAKVIHEDFLELAADSWLNPLPVYVVSNLPYSAATAILQKLANTPPGTVPGMTLMFQAEVARKLYVPAEKKDMSSLGLWLQNHWDVTKLCSAPPRAFKPPPKVQSEVVQLVRRPEPLLSTTLRAPELWQTLLKVCFAHKRKMLRVCMRVSPKWQNTLELSQVDGTKRAEALNWDEWRKLLDAALQISESRSAGSN
ncbi:MAG: 16S rRNA (adenine(1518)-N(6)/adenine(1519)-N(6))-dimethyltransferase RsmA [Bacteriovoracia bacterium]